MRLHRMLGAQTGVQHLSDQRDRNGCGLVGDLSAQFEGCIDQRSRLEDPADEASFEGFPGIEDSAGEEPLRCLCGPDDAWQEVAAAGLGYDAAPREDESHAGFGRGEANVHRQGHGGADADCWTVDGRDHGFAHLVDGQRELSAAVAVVGDLEAAVTGIEGAAARAEIGAGAEGASRPGHHERSDRVVVIGVGERRDQLVLHDLGVGVQLLRSVHFDHQSGSVLLGLDVLRHGRVPPRALWGARSGALWGAR